MVLQRLADQLGAGALTTDPEVVAARSKDEALFCPHDGAIALVRTMSVEDVQATVRFAHAHSWATGTQYAWAYSEEVVHNATEETLTLTP